MAATPLHREMLSYISDPGSNAGLYQIGLFNHGPTLIIYKLCCQNNFTLNDLLFKIITGIFEENGSVHTVIAVISHQ